MKTLGYSLAVFVAVVLTYLASVRYEFVTYDDHEYVYRNPNVMTGVSGENLLWAVKSCGYSCNWHPLTWLSLQVDAALLKEKPAAQGLYPDASLKRLSSVMHGHNVLLHGANAALLFLLIALMLKRLDPEKAVPLPIAALFALLWAIHPLRTEIVCWVSERKELLSVFWMLVTLILWTGGRTAWRYCLALVCFALALTAKPVAVTLPVVLFAWDWVMSGRRFARTLAAIVPFLLLAAGASALTLAAQVEAVDVGHQFSFVDKVIMSLSAPVIYLRQTVWPVGLSAFYPQRPPVPWVELCLGVVLLCGSIAVSVCWLRRKGSPVLSLLAFAVAWCHVSLVPMLGVVKVGDQTHSDRYTYWVGCGLAAVAALAACRYLRDREKEVTKALAVVVAVLTVATLMRMPVWRNSFSLYTDGVSKSWAEQPVCALSQLLRRQGEEGSRQAEAMLRVALTQTGYRDIRAEFAHLLAVRAEKSAFQLGEEDPAFAEARLEAETILAADPNHWLANEALAVIEMKEGKWESAERRLLIARKEGEFVERIDGELALCREQMSQAPSTKH